MAVQDIDLKSNPFVYDGVLDTYCNNGDAYEGIILYELVVW